MLLLLLLPLDMLLLLLLPLLSHLMRSPAVAGNTQPLLAGGRVAKPPRFFATARAG